MKYPKHVILFIICLSLLTLVRASATPPLPSECSQPDYLLKECETIVLGSVTKISAYERDDDSLDDSNITGHEGMERYDPANPEKTYACKAEITVESYIKGTGPDKLTVSGFDAGRPEDCFTGNWDNRLKEGIKAYLFYNCTRCKNKEYPMVVEQGSRRWEETARELSRKNL